MARDPISTLSLAGAGRQKELRGQRMSLRKISAALAARGYVTAGGNCRAGHAWIGTPGGST